MIIPDMIICCLGLLLTKTIIRKNTTKIDIAGCVLNFAKESRAQKPYSYNYLNTVVANYCKKITPKFPYL